VRPRNAATRRRYSSDDMLLLIVRDKQIAERLQVTVQYNVKYTTKMQ
jgi:hypothetical protein